MKYLLHTAMLLSAAALAQSATSQPLAFPSRPVRIVVPLAPGGNVDVTARVVSAAMSGVLNQAGAIKNRTGSGGKVGAEYAMRSPADGNTLMMDSNNSLSVAPDLHKNWPYDPLAAIQPIRHLTSEPLVRVVRPGPNIRPLADLVEWARKHPGQLTTVCAGNGTSNHLVGEHFQAMAGTSMLHVPFKGAGPALQDVVADCVAVYFDQITSSAGFTGQKRVLPLAVSSHERWKSMASASTFAEAGVGDFVICHFTGLVTPRGTPADVAARLSRAAAFSLQDDAVRKSFAGLGIEPAGGAPEMFAQVISDDLQRSAHVVREKNVRID